jgi:spermidine synthase
MAWTFSLFFLPMCALGMISPQVIRLSVPDVAHAGRVAGRVYAWSTAGAVVGTFAASYVLISTLGITITLLVVALVVIVNSLLVAKVWEGTVLLYVFSVVLGGVTGGIILTALGSREPDLIARLETNYYTIKVKRDRDPWTDEENGFRNLYLDALLHSSVNPDRPDRLHYTHEYIQMEFLRDARAGNDRPRVLVIGGGGYTFPRCAMEVLPETRMDVVEIDPGVTRVAREHLGLKEYEGMEITHMDGRQFISERVGPGTYDLVIQDAVNDFSVPSHLLTKEYNDAVKRAMKPDGVYLLTVIDDLKHGKLWKAAVHTLRQTYPADNVLMLYPEAGVPKKRHVYVIYASEKPLDLTALQWEVWGQTGTESKVRETAARYAAGFAGLSGRALHDVMVEMWARNQAAETPALYTHRVPPEAVERELARGPVIVLTDQYAPTDNLMADVFRYRTRARPEEEQEE